MELSLSLLILQVPGDRTRNARGWEGLIEEKYLRAVIKSPKESESITIDPTKLKFKIFLCNESKADLRKKGDKYALKYIEWGEKQRTKENISWMDVPSVQGRSYWWSINIRIFPQILWTEMYFDSFRTLITEEEILESDKFYAIETKDNLKYGIYLNSTLVNLFREITAFQSLGDGVLKTPVYEVENLLIPKNMPSFSKRNISKLLKREINSVSNEVKQQDRKELDAIILEAIGLDAKVYLPKIYDGLCELVKERLELPKMRKKIQKDDVRFAYGKVKTDVIDECLPDGIRKFPQDFYTKGNYEELEFETYSTNGKPLTADSFFNRYQMKTEEGETIFELDSESKAEFVEIISQHETYQIKIPAKEKIVEQIIKNYHSYISGLKDQLEANAKEKLHDWSLAEKMAKEILEEFGVNSK